MTKRGRCLCGETRWEFDRLCQVDEAWSGAWQVWMITIEAPSLEGYRFPRSIIAYAVWAYHGFAFSLRDVEGLLAEQGVQSAARRSEPGLPASGRSLPHVSGGCIRRDRPGAADKRHLDGVVISIRGRKHWLWPLSTPGAIQGRSSCRVAGMPKRPNGSCAS